MSKPEVTEDDLRNALMDALFAELAQPMKPDEFSIAMWRDRFGLTQSEAETQVHNLVRNKKIEVVEGKRLDALNHNRPVRAFRKTEHAP